MGTVEILCAAIRLADGTVLRKPRPARHHDIIRGYCQLAGGRFPRGYTEGFLAISTDTGVMRFVDRSEALAIAQEAEQILDPEMVYPKTGLMSENVW